MRPPYSATRLVVATASSLVAKNARSRPGILPFHSTASVFDPRIDSLAYNSLVDYELHRAEPEM